MYNREYRFPRPKWALPGRAWTSLADKVRPQALESATPFLEGSSLTFMGMCASVTTYILYAIVKDLLKEWPTISDVRKQRLQERESRENISSDDIEPHSEEARGDLTETQENVTFSDSNAGYTVDYSGTDDPLRNAPLNVDATLDNFFSRPIKIHEQEWGVGAPFAFKINPWSLYFSNSRVINRISNYKLMKADLHVKIILNGNSFHYGRCIVSYNPLPNQDDLTVDRTFFDADVVAASQRPHIWLNPTQSEGGEMKLPFFYYKNLIDIVSQDWNDLGELVAHSLQPLKHANGATDTVTVNVFAWAENVSFSIPTQVEPGSIAPQAMEIEPHADEYSTKPVSRIAGSIAKMAGYLTDMPVIGRFARATEMGASTIGAIATLFGYSSPVNTEVGVYTPRPKSNMANTNVQADVNKLSLDVKQELSIDPSTVGLPSEDQMTIQYIASRESYLNEFDWTVGKTPETLLWQCVVDPSLHRVLGSERHFPAPAFAVMPFKYWRGSMRFRFMVVCSGYHKGRLKIVYDPEGGIGNAEYNTAYTTLVDISEENDFTVDVGWGQATTWREHRALSGWQLESSSSALGYTASSVKYGNGTLSVYVVNELTVPNTTINNDIQVNVFVKMLDDFEVSVPTDSVIRQLRITNNSSQVESLEMVEPVIRRDATVEATDIEPHAADQIEPTKDVTVDAMANKIPVNDPSSLFHFGEAVGSFRQILKRYSLLEFLEPGSKSTIRKFLYRRPLYPMWPGYVSSPTAYGAPNSTLSAGTYNFVYMSLMRYVSSAYAAHRGGVRYLIDLSPYVNNTNQGAPGYGYISRTPDWQTPLSLAETIPSSTSSTPYGDLMNKWKATLDGCAINCSSVNPLTSIELPYYSAYRFKPSKNRDKTVSETDVFQDSYLMHLVLKGSSNANEWCPVYTAAGEDYSCFWYLGPPIFYNEPNYPTV